MAFKRDDRVRLVFEPGRHGTVEEVYENNKWTGGGIEVNWDDPSKASGIYLEDELEHMKIYLVFRVESQPNRPPIAATLRWHPDDPMAVCLFLGTGKRTRMWLFALDLLADAIDDPGETVGLGDVRIRVDDHGTLWLSLSSPSGHAVMTCQAAVAGAFVDAVDQHDDDHGQSIAEQLDWALTELLGEENQPW